jgi:hypothetical protein
VPGGDQAFDQRVAGFVIGWAPGIGNGKDRDTDRDEGSRFVDCHGGRVGDEPRGVIPAR